MHSRHRTYPATGTQKRWSFRILTTFIICSLVIALMQLGDIPTLTPAFAGKTAPFLLEGKVVSSSNRGNGCQKRQALEYIHFGGGRTERQAIATIPASHWFDVSPSGNFVLWTEQESGPLFLGKVALGKLTQKYSLKGTEEYRLLSWSPGEDLFLLVRDPLGPHPEYRVVDPVFGSSTILDTRAPSAPQTTPYRPRTFWARDGKSLVLANCTVDLKGDGSVNHRKIGLWRYDIVTYDGEVRVQNSRPLTLPDAEKVLGPAFITALSIWERDLYGQYGDLPVDYLPETLVSPSGHKAIVIGPAIMVNGARWAQHVDGYEGFLCEGKKMCRIKLKPSIGGPSTRFTWSEEEHWAHTQRGNTWIWIRTDRDSPDEEDVSIGSFVPGNSH